MDIKEEFINYFIKNGHTLYDSSKLIPTDKTLLFTNAGMVQFKDIFTKKEPVKDGKIVSIQACLRAGGKHNDLENVGFTARHHTFFEMLGNFSFGDYFKDKAIDFAWEFITEVIKLDRDKLYITVHNNDDYSYSYWINKIDKERVYKLGDKDNFWQMGDVGPCGYSSEIFYDQGDTFNGSNDYIGGDGDRYLEIWNLVFMEYERLNDKSLVKLDNPSIDTGMGLERIVAIKDGVLNNYDSSLFAPLMDKIGEIAGIKYGKDKDKLPHFRVIADHARAVTFLVAQGVKFGSNGREYVARHILRRAVRYGYQLNIKEPFIYKVCDVVIKMMSKYYPYLDKQSEEIKDSVKSEEYIFYKTLSSGIDLFNSVTKKLKDVDISGETAFKLYDTYGFPLDLTVDMAKELKLKVDIDKYNSLMNEQKERGKISWKKIGNVNLSKISNKYGYGKFTGYTKLKGDVQINALLDEEFNEVNSLSSSGWVLFNESLFYPEGGGQIGDYGVIEGFAEVTTTQKIDGVVLSHIKVHKLLKNGNTVTVEVSKDRIEIAKHHTAVHIIQKALKSILGDSITQAGSNVTATGARFDFTHKEALSIEQIDKVESLANMMVASSDSTIVENLKIDEAKKKGAIAMFDEKYGDIVRVITVGDSCELCGGVHVSNSAMIGTILITKESSVKSGVRRVEITCGYNSYKKSLEYKKELNSAKKLLKSENIEKSIEKLQTRVKELDKKSQKPKVNLNFTPVKIANIEFIVLNVEDNNLKELSDDIKNRYKNITFIITYRNKDNIKIICGSNSGIDANLLLKKILDELGGKGGGRADFAQGGFKSSISDNEFAKLSTKKIEEML